eukprot:TRINITY_DN93676_c0_g1_i1.p1 TRINITY_DN93676_c0_g1~~TRINITY_DN93676_c0_g1_i1.p1  ORF type:complete len:284 (+),score=19.20 TRINITY_DN93676_c0_g1_i1:102-953(+)
MVSFEAPGCQFVPLRVVVSLLNASQLFILSNYLQRRSMYTNRIWVWVFGTPHRASVPLSWNAGMTVADMLIMYTERMRKDLTLTDVAAYPGMPNSELHTFRPDIRNMLSNQQKLTEPTDTVDSVHFIIAQTLSSLPPVPTSESALSSVETMHTWLQCSATFHNASPMFRTVLRSLLSPLVGKITGECFWIRSRRQSSKVKLELQFHAEDLDLVRGHLLEKLHLLSDTDSDDNCKCANAVQEIKNMLSLVGPTSFHARRFRFRPGRGTSGASSDLDRIFPGDCA